MAAFVRRKRASRPAVYSEADTPQVDLCAAARRRPAHLRAALLAGTALIAAADLGLGVTAGRAQSATWTGPGADWSTGTNWSTSSVPTATATFAGATPTSITFSGATTSIGTVQLNAGAPGYSFTLGTITQSLSVTGTGIVNNSSNAPTFINDIGGTINFQNSSTAGNAAIQMHEGTLNFQNTSTAGNAVVTMPDSLHAGFITFEDSSSAGSASFTLTQAFGAQIPAELIFLNSSTAANATIANNPGAGATAGATTQFGALGGTDTADAGTAHITNNNMGATDFLASTSAMNATIVNNNGGNTNFQDQSTAANATINNNGGTTNFGVPLVGTDTATAGHAIITNTAAGTVNFDANTTAGNATITNNGGFVQFGTSGGFVTPGFADTATAGNATINNNGGTVSFSSLTNAGNANIINTFGFIFFNDDTSAGNSTISNSGSITFADSTTAGSASITTQAGGFLLSFADSSTAGNATITTNAGSEVRFTDSASGGTARFILNNGTFDISGLTIGGMTAGSIEGSGTVFLGGNTLTVGGNNLSRTFSGAITDGGTFGGTGGSLDKVGTGTLTLGGINTYTGATTVDAGTLLVNGSIASSVVTVNSGGTLGGTGTIDPVTTTIAGGGKLAPGSPANPTGTLTITGNLVFQSAAAYMIAINGAIAGKTTVTGGSATLGGASVTVAGGSTIAVGTRYTIITAVGISGTFNPSVTFGAFTGTLSYDPDDVFITFAISRLTPLLPGGAPTNVVNLAGAIDNFTAGGNSLPAGFQNLFNLAPSQLETALAQLSGEPASDAEKGAFEMMDQFLGLMLDPFVDGRSGTGWPSGGGAANTFAPERQAGLPADVALAYASVLKAPPSFDPHWSTWGASFGGATRTNGDPAVGSNTVSARDFGFAAGMDDHLNRDAVAGFALAGGGTNWGLAQGLGGGRSDAFQAGVYGAARFGQAYVAADLAFANHWMTTNRIAFAGDQLTAHFDGESFGARIESGYRYAVMPAVGITPYAALQAQRFYTPGYSETDLTGGGFGLAYNAMNATDTRSELGARFDDGTMLGAIPLALRARAAWAHDWVSNPALGAVFEALPGASFTINGAAPPSNSALLSAGAELHITRGWSLAAKFDGELASGAQTYAGTGTLRFAW